MSIELQVTIIRCTVHQLYLKFRPGVGKGYLADHIITCWPKHCCSPSAICKRAEGPCHFAGARSVSVSNVAAT